MHQRNVSHWGYMYHNFLNRGHSTLGKVSRTYAYTENMVICLFEQNTYDHESIKLGIIEQTLIRLCDV